ncbi:MAG: hypothetical protein HQL38_02035 [Alphaproteobacteria bacterium]|nr:hypothetical protein [Alphaproteobacteria bacterium]MBF0391435.1 hypothetical protein [Alphaproteobacteria bacterium]
MKTIYFKAGPSEWKYELDDAEYDLVIKSVLEDEPDLEDLLDESLETIRDLSAMADEEMDEDDEIDQAIAVAFLWHYFNHLEGEGHVDGDVVLIENDDGEGVTVIPASDVLFE